MWLSVPGGLTASSVVLAVMQNVAGPAFVKSAVPKVTAGTFDIHLNQAVRAGLTAQIGWFVVN